MDERQTADIITRICSQVLLSREKDIELPTLSAKEWSEVLSVASRQGMLPVIAQLFADISVEDARTRAVMVRGYAMAENCRQRYRHRLGTMRELATIFAEEGLDVMFMKGAALAQLYPDPQWRMFSDIDYYLFGKSAQGIEAMARHDIINSAYYHHHTQASLHGILLENHYDFVERVNHRYDIVLDDALKALAAREGRSARAAFLGDDISNAYIMTPTMNAIFLMRHMSAHFVGETIPLRQLYDWALFLQKHARDVDWKLATELYGRSGMSVFAAIVQQLLHTHLHFDCEDCPIAPGDTEQAVKVWDSIVFPPAQNPHKKFSLKYYLFETKTFVANRWKHKIVYPDESYPLLFLKYTWLGIKKMAGLLKI